jgi:hypothetical protein
MAQCSGFGESATLRNSPSGGRCIFEMLRCNERRASLRKSLHFGILQCNERRVSLRKPLHLGYSGYRESGAIRTLGGKGPI